NHLAETHFNRVDDIRKSIDDCIASKPQSFHHNGIHMLLERWIKVMESNGEYFSP
ncbi:hypothetical protein WH47_11188, partial [Habropoda laboriosa]